MGLWCEHWQCYTAGAKHAHEAHDAHVHKRAQRYTKQVVTLKMLPPMGIADETHRISNFLHTVLLKNQQKTEVNDLIEAEKQ